MVAASESGSRTSFNRANGMSEIEGKGTKVVPRNSGGSSFNPGSLGLRENSENSESKGAGLSSELLTPRECGS